MRPFRITIDGPDGTEYHLRGTTKGDMLPSDLQSVFEMRGSGILRFSELTVRTSHDEITALRSLGKLKSLVILPDGRFQEVVEISSGREKYWTDLVERKKQGGRNVARDLERQLRGMVEIDRMKTESEERQNVFDRQVSISFRLRKIIRGILGRFF